MLMGAFLLLRQRKEVCCLSVGLSAAVDAREMVHELGWFEVWSRVQLLGCSGVVLKSSPPEIRGEDF